MVSELRECNIGGGAAIFKSSQNGGPLRLLFYNIRGEVENRQVEPGGGWRWRGGEALLFKQEVDCQWLEPVFGGVLFTQCGDIPLLMAGSKKIFDILQESESDSKLETV